NGASGLVTTVGCDTAFVCQPQAPARHIGTDRSVCSLVRWKLCGWGNFANSTPSLAKVAPVQSKSSGLYDCGRAPWGRSLASSGSRLGFQFLMGHEPTPVAGRAPSAWLIGIPANETTTTTTPAILDFHPII